MLVPMRSEPKSIWNEKSESKPLIQTITAEEFERLLWACAPPNETGPIAERAAVRNKAILWVFYDTGIRVSELCGLRFDSFERCKRFPSQ